MKKSLIVGVNGQDGHYLSEFLISKSHVIIGAGRARKDYGFEYMVCDISKPEEAHAVLESTVPDEIYNLAGISSPVLNESDPALARGVNIGGVENLLAAIEECCPACRLFQASTGYIFAPSSEKKSESSHHGPDSAYGKNKLEAHLKVADARKRGIFAANGILFNHESPIRGEEFVTRKIAKAAAEFKLGIRSEPLKLGDMGAVRDWGFAGDYVEAMWLMLQAEKPKDYVIATGVGHTVEDICKSAFGYVGMEYTDRIAVEQTLLRKTGPNSLVGDPSLIRKDLNWSAKTSFEKLIGMMVEHDLVKGA